MKRHSPASPRPEGPAARRPVVPPAPPSPRRTYWHLEALGRPPTEYELLSSRLLYYPDRGFEVRSDVTDWYERYQRGSGLILADAEAFKDPRELTYARYTARRAISESRIDWLLESMETGDRDLDRSWLDDLEPLLGPLLFPIHGLQMLAGYVGQMAPGGRLAIAALFQAADEMRRVQRLAYRLRLLQRVRPEFSRSRRETWEQDARWQPLRRTLEQLLAIRDWGEAFAGLNLALKPAFDPLVLEVLADRARERGDPLFAQVLELLDDDARWHREWSVALVATAVAGHPASAGAIRSWLEAWTPRVREALVPLCRLMESMRRDRDEDLVERVTMAQRTFLASLPPNVGPPL